MRNCLTTDGDFPFSNLTRDIAVMTDYRRSLGCELRVKQAGERNRPFEQSIQRVQKNCSASAHNYE